MVIRIKNGQYGLTRSDKYVQPQSMPVVSRGHQHWRVVNYKAYKPTRGNNMRAVFVGVHPKSFAQSWRICRVFGCWHVQASYQRSRTVDSFGAMQSRQRKQQKNRIGVARWSLLTVAKENHHSLMVATLVTARVEQNRIGSHPTIYNSQPSTATSRWPVTQPHPVPNSHLQLTIRLVTTSYASHAAAHNHPRPPPWRWPVK